MTIDRLIRIFAGSFILLSLALGVPGSPLYVSSWWLAFTAFVGVNLLQYGFTNVCPLGYILHKLGVPQDNRGAHQGGAAGAEGSENGPPTGHRQGAFAMPVLTDAASRTELLNRLKRAEGQLRGIQRMLEEGQECMDIATQMAAVRKALDSTYVRMTVCFMQQELHARLGLDEADDTRLGPVLEGVQDLLGKIR